ncbi:MAG: EAL domain-containing protein, partial [Cyanobium sp.]
IRLSLSGFRRLLAMEPDLALYLNLAPSQLLDPTLADSLLEALEVERLQPAQLVLELTEHSLLEHNSWVAANLERLRGSGCRLALDDFGSGYSSLGMLMALRPDQVKIDKLFTQAIESNSEATHIVELIAALAPRLGLELVAQMETLPVMVQAFLPGVAAGDKRILLVNGEPLGAVNRVPSGGEFRSNLAVGGQPQATELTPAERAICAELAPALQAEGLFFVGIDVIDGRLSEINVTSPTGIREVERLGGIPLADQTVALLP